MAKGKRVKKRTKNKALPVIFGAVVGLAILGTVSAGAYIAGLDTVYPNVSVAGVDVGKMTFNEAHSALLNSDLALASSIKVDVLLTDDVTISLTGADVGYAESIIDAANMAMEYGRQGSKVSNVLAYLKCLSNPVDLSPSGEFNEASARAAIKEAAENVNKSPSATGYSINGSTITVKKGAVGYTVDEDAVYDYIFKVFSENGSGEFSTDKFSDKYASGNVVDVDFDAIYNEIYVAPVDAVMDIQTGETTPEVIGVSFNVDDAKQRYDALPAGSSMTIDLVYTIPENTVENLSVPFFRDVLAKKDTSLSTSSSNRITNVSLAAQAINGTILYPGDTFSFNGIVGERTADKGYQLAGAYVGGESVDQLGGGICQVSSTIYYCTLMANLKITSRSNHMYSVAYLPLGFDATVNWGTIDFKFKNDQEYPIKIISYVEDKRLYVEILGTKLDDTYVDLQYDLIETLDFEEVLMEDETIAPGTSAVKTAGHGGYVVDAYQLIYNGNGELLSRNYLGRNRYRAQNRVILVAPGSLATGGEPVDDPTPPPVDDPTPPPVDDPTPPPVDDPTPPPVDDPTPPPVDDPTPPPVDDPNPPVEEPDPQPGGEPGETPEPQPDNPDNP